MAHSLKLSIEDLVTELKACSFNPEVDLEDKEKGSKSDKISVLLGDVQSELTAMGMIKRRLYQFQIKYESKALIAGETIAARLLEIDNAMLGPVREKATRSGNALNTTISGAWRTIQNSRNGYIGTTSITIYIQP
jgi:hypothetical protein